MKPRGNQTNHHVTPLAERIRRHVTETAGGCLEWTGGVSRHDGRPTIWVGPKLGKRRASRVAYELANGPIPDGMVVCHRCDNPKCLRPEHLFLGTQADNVADMDRKGRRVTRVTDRCREAARRLGLARRGSMIGGSRLVESQVAQIKMRLAAGESQKDVAVAFGVSHSTVHLIAKGRTWTHVEVA